MDDMTEVAGGKATVDNYPAAGLVRLDLISKYGDGMWRVLTPEEAEELASALLTHANKARA